MGQTKIVMKRALRGLYAGRHIQFGNKISEDGGNKSRRSWKPNRQKRRLFSFGLDGYVRLDVTTHAIRCMDRVGGLDEYLLKLPLKDIHSEKILDLRRRIALSYDKKTMLPKYLDRKIKAVMEWNVEQKKMKGEQLGDGEVEDSDGSPALTSEPVEEDYIDKLFARFTIKPEQPPPKEILPEMGPIPFDSGRPAPFDRGRPTPDAPRRSPQEFPDSLFS